MRQRVALCGPPKSGKTTLSAGWNRVLHTDDFIHLGWSQQSNAVCRAFEDTSYDCYEGVAIARALRKYLDTLTRWR